MSTMRPIAYGAHSKNLGRAHGHERQTDHRNSGDNDTKRAEQTARSSARDSESGQTLRHIGQTRREHHLHDGRQRNDPCCAGRRHVQPSYQVVGEPHEIEGDDPIRGEARNEDPGGGTAEDQSPIGNRSYRTGFGIRGPVKRSFPTQQEPETSPCQWCTTIHVIMGAMMPAPNAAPLATTLEGSVRCASPNHL